MSDSNNEMNPYCEIEPEDFWIPKNGESEEDCNKRIHKRVKEEFGEEYEAARQEVLELLDFDEFIRKNS